MIFISDENHRERSAHGTLHLVHLLTEWIFMYVFRNPERDSKPTDEKQNLYAYHKESIASKTSDSARNEMLL